MGLISEYLAADSSSDTTDVLAIVNDNFCSLVDFQLSLIISPFVLYPLSLAFYLLVLVLYPQSLFPFPFSFFRYLLSATCYLLSEIFYLLSLIPLSVIPCSIYPLTRPPTVHRTLGKVFGGDCWKLN